MKYFTKRSVKYFEKGLLEYSENFVNFFHSEMFLRAFPARTHAFFKKYRYPSWRYFDQSGNPDTVATELESVIMHVQSSSLIRSHDCTACESVQGGSKSQYLPNVLHRMKVCQWYYRVCRQIRVLRSGTVTITT